MLAGRGSQEEVQWLRTAVKGIAVMVPRRRMDFNYGSTSDGLILGTLIRDWLVVGSGSVPIQCAEDRRGRPPVVGHGGVERPSPSAAGWEDAVLVLEGSR